jgi:hypothetical protein
VNIQIEEEMHAHLEMCVQNQIDRGLKPEQARAEMPFDSVWAATYAPQTS